MKLKWFASGTGAGYYVDLYVTEDGRKVLIGTERDDKPLREEIAEIVNNAAVPQS